MSLFSGKRRCLVGLLVLGLVSCAPRSAAPDADSQSIASAPILEPTPAAPDALVEGDIWSQLRQAETHYYVLMRHAIAPGTGDPANFQLDDCSTQRNLSEAGRDQARRTGDVFRENNVAVEQVFSSAWCRCLETAELMDLAPVERLPALNSFFRDRAQGPEQTQQLREFMVNNQDKAGVTVLVTHFVNVAAIVGSGVSSGEMVVMRVNEQDEAEIVDFIEPL
ncbi:MAG: histidine phosphatase family protein [Cyanobacteria bacterium P01_H01_bin.105]